MSQPRFVIKRAKGGEWYFVFQAGNSEIVVTSEMYERRAGAVTGIASLKTSAATAEVVVQDPEQKEGEL